MTETIERFDIRLPADAKRLLMQAAEVSGNTLTGLVLNAALDKAREIMESHRHLVLSTEEWQRFVALLDEPPEPNENLKLAWREYKNSGAE